MYKLRIIKGILSQQGTKMKELGTLNTKNKKVGYKLGTKKGKIVI